MNEKMIEEMAKDLKECLPNNWYWQKSVDSDTYFVAKHFYNAGYRNCKDKVVLSKEEYEILINQNKGLKEENHTLRLENNDLEAQVEQARKEAVIEFLTELFKQYSVFNDNDVIIAWQVKEALKNTLKQLGVKVEE